MGSLPNGASTLEVYPDNGKKAEQDSMDIDMDPSTKGLEQLKAHLDDKKKYKDLTNLIVCDEEQPHPMFHGGCSDVYTGSLKGRKVAIKVLRIEGETQDIERIRKYLSREAAVWNEVNHPNVLPFLGLADGLRLTNKNFPALISPYCDKGTSGDFVRRQNPPTHTRVTLILGVARGLKYLHGEGIVHGDLKPNNVLIGENDEPLLCDFGCSKMLQLRGFTTKPAGTVRYQAREIIGGEGEANKSTDVCAFGLTGFEIWTGARPYATIINENAVTKHIILYSLQQELPNPPPDMHGVVWPILQPCLSHEIDIRPDMHTVAQSLELCVSSFSEK